MKKWLARLLGADATYIVLIFLMVGILSCWAHGIKGPADLQIPKTYGSDGIAVYAIIKAFASGEIMPGLSKFVPTLNAPFTANWNDTPFEDLIYFPAGLLARIFGLSAGSWFYLVGIQILAGMSFYLAARVLDFDKRVSAACAVIFALSPFAFYRGLIQATVFVFWHVPLLIVSVLWCLDPARMKITQHQGLLLGIVVGLLAGSYNPYYWAMFLFLLGIIAAGAMHRREWRHAFRVTAIAASALAAFLVFNGHVILFSFLYGTGAAVVRDLSGLIIWGLRLPDLVTPVETRFAAYDALFNFYRNSYPSWLRGEAQTAYIGLVALTGLAGLVIGGTVRVAARKFDQINHLYWVALGIFCFAVVGGINYLLGAFGFVLLRATNRYAIMLMAIGLLAVAQAVSAIRKKWLISLLAPALLAIGLYDQLPPPMSLAAKAGASAKVSEDRTVASMLERELPPDAMVFQLPVHAFPEAGPVEQMEDYDLFRPWLWTRNIRFSYGTMKGRTDADWQIQLTKKSADQMLDDLNRFGFSAILIQRGAYVDKADELKGAFARLGYEIFIDQPNYVGFKLRPAAQPELPHFDRYVIKYGKGFYGPETDGSNAFHWAAGDAVVRIARSLLHAREPNSAKPTKVRVSFSVSTLDDRKVWLEVGSARELVSGPDGAMHHASLELEIGRFPVSLHFVSDRAGAPPGNGDTRKLAFQVRNLAIDLDK